jgi:hypothetical protein
MTNKINIRENRQLLRRLLSEGPLVTSKADEYKREYGKPYVPKESWEGQLANYEKLIKTLGGLAYPMIAGHKAAYEFKLGNDLLRAYPSGALYSTNPDPNDPIGKIGRDLGYGIDKEFSPNGLTVYDTPAKKTIIGAIENQNGRLTWRARDTKEIEKDSEETWVDYVQYALTGIGFIPGFGDIADIINAVISFYRYSTEGDTMYAVDGFLNLIGAIPVVGSVIAVPVKIAFKGLNRGADYLVAMFKGGKSADEVWAALRSEGTLDPKTLNALSDGMGDIASAIKSFRNKADWMLSSTAARKLDDFADWLSLNSRSSREIFEASAKRADDAVQGAGKFRGKGILKKMDDMPDWGTIGNIIPRGIRKKLVGIFTRALSPQELQKLRGLLDAKFTVKCNNPDVLTSLFKTMPRRMSMRTLDGRVISNAQDVSGYLYSLSKTNPAAFKTMKTQIIDRAIASNNPLYKNFMNSEVNALKAYVTNPGTFIGSGFNRFSNMVPIIWNEMKDMGEDALMAAGIETKDDVNGLFWPMFKSLMGATTYIPFGIGKASQGAQDYVSGAVGGAMDLVPQGIKTIGGAIIDPIIKPDEGKPYDPNVDFKIVPDEDPRLKTQTQVKKKEAEKRIQQKRSWF